ncbi:hypothetical protein BKA82DRAFT_4016332 [Pisolithus tinctorius]|nr:hypothetical protein BKA82DRAFT_4016332 [Pisolithus tinctorius]
MVPWRSWSPNNNASQKKPKGRDPGQKTSLGGGTSSSHKTFHQTVMDRWRTTDDGTSPHQTSTIWLLHTPSQLVFLTENMTQWISNVLLVKNNYHDPPPKTKNNHQKNY